jgi:hypothetical protein
LRLAARLARTSLDASCRRLHSPSAAAFEHKWLQPLKLRGGGSQGTAAAGLLRMAAAVAAFRPAVACNTLVATNELELDAR